MMLPNLSLSVLWRYYSVVYLCGLGLFFFASGAAAQEKAFDPGFSSNQALSVAGELTSEPPLEAGLKIVSAYEVEVLETPVYDSTTAVTEKMPAEAALESCESCLPEESPSTTAVVKNVNYFGVDDDTCCDEWSGFCKIKDMPMNCGCGGLKARKGHLGIPWLRSADEGEDCDYCQGGCCGDNNAAGKQRRQTRRSALSYAWTSAWSKATRGNCESCSAATTCKTEGCTSCR